MGQASRPGEGQVARMAGVRGRLRTGSVERTGETLSAAVLARRVGWAADLVSAMASSLLVTHWNATDVGRLAAGVDADGRTLPSHAWTALRRLGWTVAPPAGVTVNDRIVRMAQEQAGRILRAAAWRAGITAGVLATWPRNPDRRTEDEWEAVRAAVPDGGHLPSTVITARTRQAAAFARQHGRPPADVFELESAPRAAAMLVLSACDRQQAVLVRGDDPRRVHLRLLLPVRPDPCSYADWAWVSCPLLLPATVPTSAALHLPTLRVRQGRVQVELAFTHAVPAAARTGHAVALGVDWGLHTLLSAAAVRLRDDGRITALGAGAMFRAAGVLAKQHRLRRQGERLRTKADRYRRLTGDDPDHPLAARYRLLTAELGRVRARRSHLNGALARAAARWSVDQAIAIGATVIYVEDLRSLEARGMGRTLNTRLSQLVRGQIVARMRHLAAEAGIAVVTVPARDTSRRCPCCLTPLRHGKAPDRPTVAGWKWAICPGPGCGWQGDRDAGACRRIAARGLTHQTKTVASRSGGALAVRAVVDRLERRAVVVATPDSRDRTKTGPTRPRSTRPAPRRRGAPSSAGSPGQADQRPEGRAHTDRRRLPRAADRHQGAITISTVPARRHRPRGAVLGAGFHLHAHATPPLWADPSPDMTSRGRTHG
ncbi:zinc ribbon domain-containing protein [Streptomyces sp. NPDC003703]|uniref:zinc ribbon domain-containing protein n=1 Tax=Streptomyces sp. NPDC003283 TaxID=3364681 RepID=UPI0036AEB297